MAFQPFQAKWTLPLGYYSIQSSQPEQRPPRSSPRTPSFGWRLGKRPRLGSPVLLSLTSTITCAPQTQDKAATAQQEKPIKLQRHPLTWGRLSRPPRFMLVGKYQFFPLVFPQQADFPSHLCHFLYNSFFKRKITNSSFKYILSSSGKKCYWVGCETESIFTRFLAICIPLSDQIPLHIFAPRQSDLLPFELVWIHGLFTRQIQNLPCSSTKTLRALIKPWWCWIQATRLAKFWKSTKKTNQYFCQREVDGVYVCVCVWVRVCAHTRI